MRRILIALAASAAFIAPANAAVVFSDNFDGEGSGNSILNYTNYANFDSTGGGATDLIHTGNQFSIDCAGGSGACVDLDGSPGPGELTSKAFFAFNAGDVVRLSYDLSGNQRIGGSDDWYSGFTFAGLTQINDYGFNYFGSDNIVNDYLTTNISTSSSDVLGDAFTTKSIFFTAGTAGSVQFFIGSGSVDNRGPILDNVTLSIGGAVPEPATWAMMIMGFGVIGSAMRRRTRVRYAAA